MVLNGEERLECQGYVDGIRLQHIPEFKYLGCVLDESGTDGADNEQGDKEDMWR